MGAMPTSLAAEADEPKGLLAPRPTQMMLPRLPATTASAVNDRSRQREIYKDARVGQRRTNGHTETDRAGQRQITAGCGRQWTVVNSEALC